MKKKLKVDDHVLIVTIKEKSGEIRVNHDAKIDQVKTVVGGVVGLKRYDKEIFNDEGVCDNPKKKLIKIRPAMRLRILGTSALRGNLNKINKITLDDSFFDKIEKDNDNE